MIELRDVSVSYPLGGFLGFGKNVNRAVEGVSLEIQKGETLGLVGESGCGKSTLGRAIVKLSPLAEGEIYFQSNEVGKLTAKEFLPFRKKMQIIFQDPYSSLNPRMTVGEIVSEGLRIHEKNLKPSELEKRTVSILDKVSLSKESIHRYPHEFSGGQRQRISVARSLILNPDFVVCDEAVSALDVSTQAQVLRLLKDLKAEIGLSYLFISHDLSVVRAIADRIAVMYLGKILELGSAKDIVDSPLHPYTKALFDSSFDLKDRKKKRFLIKGETPSSINKPNGCYFHTRCPKADEICRRISPEWKNHKKNQFAACHFPEE